MEEVAGKLDREMEQMARRLSLPGASVLIARVEKPQYVNDLATELQRRLKFPVERWEFSPEQLNLPGYLLSISNGSKKVVFAFGLEKLGPSVRKKAYSILNLGREKIGQSGCSLVTWLPGRLIEELLRYAPDFWAWVQSVHPLTLPDDEVERERTLAALRLRGEEELKQLRRRYLDYITVTYRWLDFRGIMQVRNIVRFPLDRIFVPLIGIEWRMVDLRMMDEERQMPPEDSSLAPRPSPPAPRPSPLAPRPSPLIKEERKVPLEEAWREHRLLVILGDPGSGKSTFLKHLALTFALGTREEERFPILIPIAEYLMARSRLTSHAPRPTLSLLEFIARHFQEQGLPDLMPLFVSELERGRGIVLLDGLDEVLTLSERREIAQEIENLARRYPLSRFIVTSRIAGYDSAPLSADFITLTITPFNEEQIKAFAHNWARAYEAVSLNYHPDERGWPPFPPEAEKRIQERADDLARAVTGHPAIKRLATNPLLLTILALIHQQGTRLPQRRVELYRLCVEALAETWNLARSLSGKPIELWLGERRLDAGEVVRVLGPVAFWMQENRPGGLIERDKLEELIAQELMRGGQVWVEEEARRLAAEFVDLMREQMGLMLERGMGQFGFMHLSFQEYLAARHVAAQEDPFATLRPHLFDPRWREVVLLTAAILGDFSPAYATRFLRRVYQADAPYKEILRWPLLLAARILADDTPVDMELARSILGEFCGLLRTRYGKLHREMGTILEMLGPTRYGVYTAQLLLSALRDEDEWVRERGAWALGELGRVEPEVVEGLLSALRDKDGDVRARAAWALGELGSAEPEVVKGLLSALRDENWTVRAGAAEALGELGRAEPEVLEGLLSALRDEDGDVRAGAAEALGELGRAEPEVVKGLFLALQDKNEYVHYEVAKALGKLNKTKPGVMERLFSALRDDNAEVRAKVAEALVVLGETEPEVVKKLFSALQDKDEKMRAGAVEVLGRLGRAEPEVVEGVLSALQDEDILVRRTAAEALGQLGKAEPEVIKGLLLALQDDDEKVRAKVAKALGKLGRAEPEVVEGLLSALQDESAEVRARAAEALGRLGKAEPEVARVLLSALQDESAEVRAKAAEALGKLGKVEPEVVTGLFSALRDDNAEVRAGAAEVLGELGRVEPEVVEGFLSALRDEVWKWEVRWITAKALERLGRAEPAAVNGLLSALQDKDEKVRAMAVEVLGKLGRAEPEVVEGLLSALQDEDESVRAEAAEALGKLDIPYSLAKKVCGLLARVLESRAKSLKPSLIFGWHIGTTYDLIFEALWSLAEKMVKTHPPADSDTP